MNSRSARTQARRLLIGASLVVAFLAPGQSVRGQADDLPPDDGAPPSDYVPSPRGRSDRAQTRVGPNPASPPLDNAFPISAATRSACSDSFGDPRSGGRTHLGVDCFAPLGRPLIAVETGTIRYATPAGPYNCSTGVGDGSGNRVSVRGRSGYVYYYGHLDTIAVATGQPVVKGQVIGTVGRTGNACGSAHLHFEVKCGENGDPFDPFPVLATWGSPGPPETAPPSTNLLGVGVARSGGAREDLFALECGEAIRQRSWYPGSGFSPVWYSIEGAASSDPDAASPGAGSNPQAFVRGLDSATWLITWNGVGWMPVSLGGVCTSGPTAAYASVSHLDVFCRGSNRAIYQRTWDAGIGWSPYWTLVGGEATSDPDAASAGPDYTADVFVRGLDGSIYHMYLSENGWVAESLGGYCTSGPSAAFSGPDRLDVFCRGSDLALYHRWWQSDVGWGNWDRIDSIVISDPEAVPGPPGSVASVFVRGLDRTVYEFEWTGRWTALSWGFT